MGMPSFRHDEISSFFLVALRMAQFRRFNARIARKGKCRETRGRDRSFLNQPASLLLLPPKHPLPMPLQIRPMLRAQPRNLQAFVHLQQYARFLRQLRRNSDPPVVLYRYESQVEKRIVMRREQEPIVHIETFRIRFAIRPRFDMACSQQLGHREPRNRTAIMPIIAQCCAKQFLPHALHDEPLGFRGFGQMRRLTLETKHELVR